MFTSGMSSRASRTPRRSPSGLGVELRDFPFIFDLDRLEALIGNLPGKGTELIDEPDEGF